MKRFQFQYTKTMKVLMYLALLLCVAAFALNAWSFFQTGIEGFYSALRYAILLLVTVGGFVILLSMLISSAYIVTDKELITAFGIIRSKFKLSEIEKLTLNSKTKKLSVTFENGTYMVFIVNETWHEELIATIREKKPSVIIEYIGEDDNV